MINISFKAGFWVPLLLGVPGWLLSQGPSGHFPIPETKYEVRVEPSTLVPMRGGVSLSTDLFFPKGVKEKLPLVLIRTPYNKKSYRKKESAAYFFAQQGYIVAV